MITKWHKENTRNLLEMVDLDSLVPKNSPLRKMDSAISNDMIYERTEEFYVEKAGRPSCDPAVFFRIILLKGYMKEKTVKKTVKLAEDSLSARWFLGYSLTEKLPSYSAFSSAFRERFPEELTKEILADIYLSLYKGKAMSATALGFPSAASVRGKGRGEKLASAARSSANRTFSSLRREIQRKKK